MPDSSHLNDAHYNLMQAEEYLQRARFSLAKAGLEDYKWDSLERRINRASNSIKNMIESVVYIRKV